MGGRRKSYTEKIFSRRRKRKVVARILVLLLLVGFVRAFLLRTYHVGTDSMEPSLSEGDRLLASPIVSGAALWFGTLPPLAGFDRGDLVIVSPTDPNSNGFLFSLWDSLERFFTLQHSSPARRRFGSESIIPGIYRIIGLPGDSVRMHQGFFEIRSPGQGSYVTEYAASASTYALKDAGSGSKANLSIPLNAGGGPIALPEGMYFVASDDRATFTGSILWGPVSRSRIVGKPFLRFWPLSRFSFL
ncbi:MAG: signal peptidase I [Spirochaetes bacterium]|nr:MAG: signal peptidase I [Spirochaetota bacterium]